MANGRTIKRVMAALSVTLAASMPAQAAEWGIFIDSTAFSRAGPLSNSGKLAYCTGSRYENLPTDKPCGYAEVNSENGGVFSQYFNSQTELSLRQKAYSNYAVRYPDGRYHFAFGQGETTAGADLADGTLRFTTLGMGGGNVGGGGAGAINQVSMFDTITFSGLTTPVQIGFDIRVDGTFEINHQPRFGFQFYNAGRSQLNGTHLLTGTVGWAGAGPTSTGDPTSLFMDGFGTGRDGTWTTFGPNRFIGSVLIDPSSPIYGFHMYLSGGGSGISDFGHTAQIGWTLPDNVTYTSASGGFMVGRATAVPEPATWAMLVLGFGIAGGALRTRRQTNQPMTRVTV